MSLYKTLLLATAPMALLAPLAAHAADASQTVSLTGTVAKRCQLGSPSTTTLSLGDLTDANGRLSAGLRTSAVVATSAISDAWCNAPSVMTVAATPLTLQNGITYAGGEPAGFTRYLTYNASVSGWPTTAVNRPVVGSAAVTVSAAEPRSNAVTLEISALQTLNGTGASESADLVLEAGAYQSSVTITLATSS